MSKLVWLLSKAHKMLFWVRSERWHADTFLYCSFIKLILNFYLIGDEFAVCHNFCAYIQQHLYLSHLFVFFTQILNEPGQIAWSAEALAIGWPSGVQFLAGANIFLFITMSQTAVCSWTVWVPGGLAQSASLEVQMCAEVYSTDTKCKNSFSFFPYVVYTLVGWLLQNSLQLYLSSV